MEQVEPLNSPRTTPGDPIDDKGGRHRHIVLHPQRRCPYIVAWRHSHEAARYSQIQPFAGSECKRFRQISRIHAPMIKHTIIVQTKRLLQRCVKSIFVRSHGDVMQTGRVRLIHCVAEHGSPAKLSRTPAKFRRAERSKSRGKTKT